MNGKLLWFFQLLMLLIIVICKIIISILAGYAVYAFFAPLAYIERGYVAFGGECILAIVASMAIGFVLFSTQKFFEKPPQQVQQTKYPNHIHPNCRCKIQAYIKHSGR